MEIRYFNNYSPSLHRDMECLAYGHGGRPVLFIPCQDGNFHDFENYHMVDTWSPWIESGEVTVYSIDTVDKETWSDRSHDAGWRSYRHEEWMNYIFTELVPFIQTNTRVRNGWGGTPGIIAFGCSLGATHAANLYFRHPDLFCGLLALSGVYDAAHGWDGYMDDRVYLNSPVHYLPNFPTDHPYMDLFRANTAIMCCGQGAWEQPGSTVAVRDACDAKGIPIWCDLWGTDVNHDWPWWHKQVEYFVPRLLG